MINFISGVCLSIVFCIAIDLMIKVNQPQDDNEKWEILFSTLKRIQVEIDQLKEQETPPTICRCTKK